MSTVSGGSSGTSNASARQRGRVRGVPKRCWCGEAIVEKISRSDANPYRRYYRCVFAAENKLVNDNHTFKWVDEALLNEIEVLKTARIEQPEKEDRTEMMEKQKLVFEKMLLKVEKEIYERVDDALLEAKTSMKIMMVLVVLVGMIMIGVMKLVG